MGTQKNVNVAILLATYNGGKFVGQQIESLKENNVSFFVAWIDDHSTDNTCDVVRETAKKTNIRVEEFHQKKHLGMPGTFFHLLESVEADIYMYCDQDDIWQPGKIDATVASLCEDIDSPLLCFSDPLWFSSDSGPDTCEKLWGFTDSQAEKALQKSRSFMFIPAFGHTIGFTRRLRDIFMKHKEVAKAHAYGHDWWMYLIAMATGQVRMLSGVPTTLYRRHPDQFSSVYYTSIPKGKRGLDQFPPHWELQQAWRRIIAKQASGFIIASSTFPQGVNATQLLTIATIVSKIDQKQSLITLIRLACSRAMWPRMHVALRLAFVCLRSDAKEPSVRKPQRSTNSSPGLT